MCRPSEKRIIDDWFAAISTDKKPFSDEEDMNLSKERSWMRIDECMRYEDEKICTARRIPFLQWSMIGIAATLLLLLMVGLYSETSLEPGPGAPREIFSDYRLITNDGKKVKEFILPDASKIQLLKGTSIRFSRLFGAQKREVHLDGEAFFEVTPDTKRPFLVYTHELTAEVLGTSFLIKAYNQQKEIVVSVKTGKVSVYTNINSDTVRKKSHQEVVLSPNQQIVYKTDEQLTLMKLVNEPQVILTESTLKDSYTNAPVIDILNNLEENYGIDIQYDATVLTNCTLTSDMSDESFYEQIKIICNALGAQYKVVETAIIIEATGCNPY